MVDIKSSLPKKKIVLDKYNETILPNSSLCDLEPLVAYKKSCLETRKRSFYSILAPVLIGVVGIILLVSYRFNSVSFETGVLLGKIGIAVLIFAGATYLLGRGWVNKIKAKVNSNVYETSKAFKK